MRPNYKNWVPKNLLIAMFAGSAVLAVLFAVAFWGSWFTGTTKTVLSVVFGILTIVLLIWSILYLYMYKAFSYDGDRQISRHIIDKVSDYMILPEDGVGLDIGCGSGALTIACAKKNPQGRMLGLDHWGKEYDFSKKLCEENAKIEGVSDNTSFTKGNACSLDYEDETFDAITSNYCYHNIPSRDRQSIILESLRTLKKGGRFVIHDYFTKGKYGDLQKLVRKLNEMGYEEVELLDTMDGLFLPAKEAKPLCLTGSALLIGKK